MRKEAEDKEKLLAELRRLSDGAATLKGMLAGLKVEFYSRPSLVPRYAPPIPGPPSNPSTPLGPAPSYRSSSSLLDRSFDAAQRLSPASVIAESVAHKLLSEQKPLLIRGLQDFAKMNQCLSDETRDQLRELDQAHFYDAQECVDGDVQIKIEDRDASFSLEDGLMQAPRAQSS
ncbi:hypothetical protein VFPPC_04929 [Pochonia chlamydosporia 170]|uniref:Uncharacterized protein n=1 Tax=Pochonia chlamydosporia 170 TaxID=1380566 RepID=A0A179FUQ1_METCM|nr:hypothetical protein VFPPC_04929 [Pochonia chlamydosporia 170]OAQ68729.1 hypothetical protein VFPPC_04929 [Pochonia chlamydosporia 170]